MIKSGAINSGNTLSVPFSLQGIGCQFPEGPRIEIVQAQIRQGERLLISGPSGCGKSTILGLLSLSLKPTHGKQFHFGKENILYLWKHARQDRLTYLRAANFGFIPQNAGLLPFLTVQENILLPQSILGKKDRSWVSQLIERLDIGNILSHKVHEISIGQRQRVAVARALVNRPFIIMADEPTASVHPALADVILRLLMQMVVELGSTLIMTSHDVRRALDHGVTEAACQLDPQNQRTRWVYG